MPSFIWLVALSIPLGLGQGAVDSSLNNYVANNYSSRHMNWLHCFWGLGATLGPLIMTKTLEIGQSWRTGYSNIAAIQIGLAFILLISLNLWQSKEIAAIKKESSIPKNRGTSVLKAMAPWLGIIMFFIYAGIEFSVGLWANSMLVESRNIPKITAGLWISYYYGALTAGRLATGIIVNKMGNRLLIRAGLIIGFAGILLASLPTLPLLTMTGIILIGLGFAPLYPCMMHETPRRFDEETTNRLIGYQVGAAYLGASLIPAGLGVLFSKTTLEILMPCLAVFLITMIIIYEWQNDLGEAF